MRSVRLICSVAVLLIAAAISCTAGAQTSDEENPQRILDDVHEISQIENVPIPDESLAVETIPDVDVEETSDVEEISYRQLTRTPRPRYTKIHNITLRPKRPRYTGAPYIPPSRRNYKRTALMPAQPSMHYNWKTTTAPACTQVVKAEKYELPLWKTTDKWFGSKHNGVVVTLDDGRRLLIIKGYEFGRPKSTEVLDAAIMSNYWQLIDSKTVDKATVKDYIKECELGGNSRLAAVNMMQLD